MFRKLHNRMAYLSLVWMTTTLSGIAIGIIKLGHIPRYTYDPDMTDLGFGWYVALEFIVGLAAVLNIFIWPAVYWLFSQYMAGCIK